MPFFLCAAFAALLLDQGSKMLVRARLPVGARLEVLPGWMHFEHVQNQGAAWGVLSGQKWLLVVFTLAVIAVIGASAREVAARGKLAAFAFGLILGGALGNLLDRIAFSHVTDFFDLDTPWRALQTFPVFNVADSALTVGVLLMLLSLALARPQTRRALHTSHS